MMITRYLSSATAGVAVTTGLLYVMQLLIASGEEVWSAPSPRIPVIWAVNIPDEPVIRRPPPVLRPPPAELPRTPPATDAFTDGPGIFVPTIAPPPPVFTAERSLFWSTDGPLVSIYRGEPVYPGVAEQRGIEGFVTVRFDVNELGGVENVSVVESSNTLFEKAAVSATYRFKFKPRVSDGQPLPTRGLQNLFRFRMPD